MTKKELIILLHKDGKTKSEIMRTVQSHYSYVNDVIKEYTLTESLKEAEEKTTQ